MEGKSTIIIVVLVVGLLIGAGAGYMLAPETIKEVEVPVETIKEVEVPVKVHPLDGQTIKFPALAPYAEPMEGLEGGLKIAKDDVNDYCKKLGYDIEFDYMIEECQKSTTVALEKTQSYHSMGLDLVIAPTWSGMCAAALSYVNENDMVFFSAASTAPSLAIAGDNLFRNVCTDTAEGLVVANMVWDFGIDAVVVIMRGDTWGDGIYDVFASEYEKLGGTIVEKIRYASETTDFSPYIDAAEAKLKEAVEEYGVDHVAIEALVSAEFVPGLAAAADYPTLMSVKWFGSGGSRMTQFCTEVGELSEKVRFFSTMRVIPRSDKFYDIVERYEARTGLKWDFARLSMYDIFWMYALSVLEAGTTDAKVIKEILPDVASRYYGATGWCGLDEYGDRPVMDYEVHLVREEDGEYNWVQCGEYHSTTKGITWDTSMVEPMR